MPRQVVVDISSSKLTVAVLSRRRELRRASIRHGVPLSEPLASLLERTRESLADLVDRVDAHGLRATVVYSNQSACVGMHACPSSAGSVGAQSAARLAMAEAAGFPIDENPAQIRVCLKDRAGEPRVHAIGIAETDENAQLIAEWLRSAGLRVCRLVPGLPAAMLLASRTVTEAGSGTHVALYVGRRSSIVAGGAGGKLLFVRAMSSGFDQLVEALTRGIKSDSGQQVVLDLDEAEALLAEVGIPRPDRPFDETRGLGAQAVLPLIQPALQRMILEIKQTLRFGMDAELRRDATLHLVGSAAHLPALGELIAEQCTLQLRRDAEAGRVSAPDAITSFLEVKTPLGVVPTAVSSQRTVAGVQRALGVGAAIGFIVAAADGVDTHFAIQRLRATTSVMNERVEYARRITDVSTEVEGLRSKLVYSHREVHALTKSTTRWEAILALLSKETPASIRLSRIQLAHEATPVSRIRGEVRSLDEVSATTLLRNYMEAIQDAPIVSRCRIGFTNRDRVSPGLQQFEVIIELEEVPRTGALSNLSRLADAEPTGDWAHGGSP